MVEIYLELWYNTGKSKNRPETMAHSLARLIALEFGYDEEWILHGASNEGNIKN